MGFILHKLQLNSNLYEANYSFFIPGNAPELATLSLPECIQTKMAREHTFQLMNMQFS